MIGNPFSFHPSPHPKSRNTTAVPSEEGWWQSKLIWTSLGQWFWNSWVIWIPYKWCVHLHSGVWIHLNIPGQGHEASQRVLMAHSLLCKPHGLQSLELTSSLQLEPYLQLQTRSDLPMVIGAHCCSREALYVNDPSSFWCYDNWCMEEWSTSSSLLHHIPKVSEQLVWGSNMFKKSLNFYFVFWSSSK